MAVINISAEILIKVFGKRGARAIAEHALSVVSDKSSDIQVNTILNHGQWMALVDWLSKQGFKVESQKPINVTSPQGWIIQTSSDLNKYQNRLYFK